MQRPGMTPAATTPSPKRVTKHHARSQKESLINKTLCCSPKSLSALCAGARGCVFLLRPSMLAHGWAREAFGQWYDDLI